MSSRINRSTGRFHDCLDRMKDRLADPTGDRICESLRIAREVGGCDLGRLLRTLSAFLRDDACTRAELETRQGWVVNAARLAVAGPWLLLGLLSLQTESIRAYNASGALHVAGHRPPDPFLPGPPLDQGSDQLRRRTAGVYRPRLGPGGAPRSDGWARSCSSSSASHRWSPDEYWRRGEHGYVVATCVLLP
jgi:hypothetical protein